MAQKIAQMCQTRDNQTSRKNEMFTKTFYTEILSLNAKKMVMKLLDFKKIKAASADVDVSIKKRKH